MLAASPPPDLRVRTLQDGLNLSEFCLIIVPHYAQVVKCFAKQICDAPGDGAKDAETPVM